MARFNLNAYIAQVETKKIPNGARAAGAGSPSGIGLAPSG